MNFWIFFVIFVGLTHSNLHIMHVIIGNYIVSSRKLLSLMSSIDIYIYISNCSIRILEHTFFRSIGVIQFRVFYTTRMSGTQIIVWKNWKVICWNKWEKLIFLLRNQYFLQFLAVDCGRKIEFEKCSHHSTQLIELNILI